MGAELTADEVWEGVGQALAGPLPSRRAMGEMVRALRLVEGQLVRGLDRYPIARGQVRWAQHALIEMRSELDWIEHHPYGVLRTEIVRKLRRAHFCVGVILATLQDGARAGQQAG